MRSQYRINSALAATLFIWSTAAVGVRHSIHFISPNELALYRFLIASLTLLFLSFIFPLKRPKGNEWFWIFVGGLLGVLGYHWGFNNGARFINAPTMSLVINLAPTFTALFATLVLKEKVNIVGWLAIFVSFTGVAILAVGRGETIQINIGVLYVSVSALCASLYAILQKSFLKRLTSFEFTAYTIWAGTLLILPNIGSLYNEMQLAPVTAHFTAIYLGIFSSAIGYLTWAYVLERKPASQVMPYIYLLPVLTTFFSWALLKELPEWRQALGGLVILLGILILHFERIKLMSFKFRKKTPSASPPPL